MNTKISVRDAKRLADGRFEARVVVTRYDDPPRTYAVSTNIHGDGFWIDGNQKTGTGQFQVRTVDAWRAAVRRWFSY